MKTGSIKKQYRVQLEADLIKQIEAHAKANGYHTGPQVAADVIRRYFPLWLKAETLKQMEIRRQVDSAMPISA